MPSRWWVPVNGIRPEFVKLHHIHGAVTRWFDDTTEDHEANEKPYAISPLGAGPGDSVGIEIATLTDEAARRVVEHTAPGQQIRLGNQTRHLGRARELRRESWNDLLSHGEDRQWTLEFVTPTTFRSGNRSSPLPLPATIVQGLQLAWSAASTMPAPATAADVSALWVSDLDLRSEVLTLPIRRRDGQADRPVVVSGCLGSLTMRCDDPEVSARLGPLLRLAAYTGVGSFTRKGLGVTRVTARRAPPRHSVAPRTPAPHDHHNADHGRAG